MKANGGRRPFKAAVRCGQFSLLFIPLLFIFLVIGCGSGAGDSAPSPVPATPPVPTDLAAEPSVGIVDARVDLSWEPVGGDVFHIDLERRELLPVRASALGSISAPEQPSWSNWKKIALIAPEVSSFPDFGAGCGKQYEYQLCNNFGNGDRVCSLPIQAATPLCPPKDLTATLVSPGTVELNWVDNSDDEIWFKIYRKTAPDGPYEQIGAVFANVTTYTDTDLLCGTTYLYKIRAVNGQWESGYSNAVSIQAQECIPFTPSDLIAFAISISEIELIWTDNSDNELGFSIERSASSGGPFTEIVQTTADVEVFTDSGLSPGTTYYYRVRAFNSSGYSSYSDEASATTLSPDCSDGIDNDGDTLSDWPDDPGCAGVNDLSEWGQNQCDDGVDNDGDTLIDYSGDPNCISAHGTNESGVWYVDIDATGARTGLSWKDAFNHPQDAMYTAFDGDMIWVAEGTYTRPPGAASTDPVLVMVDGIEIYGGFEATESTLSQRGNPADCPTVLDGENTSYRTILGTSYASLDGFIVTRGYGDESYTHNGLYYKGGGGGMFNSYVDGLVVSNCIFTDNWAARNGGGLYSIESTNVTVTDCEFVWNSVPGGNTSYGGGMCEYLTSTTMKNLVFFENSAYYGGGFSTGWHSGVVSNCAFIGNTASTGGGMDNYHSENLITNCTFSGNSASNRGGGLHNRKLSYGGYPQATIMNSVFWGNDAPRGPEIYDSSSIPLIVTYSDVRGGWSGTGNINADPLFEPYPDLHLQGGSPCIDAGNPGPQYNDPDGTRNDMGAYPYQ